MSAPSIPKGTRDFGPSEMANRNYIFDHIKSVFKLFGFAQLETPSMENLNVLTGKYGDEGDQLIFKILNSGDYLKKVTSEELNERNIKNLLPKISEKALRYDLTVPFARYVTMNKGQLQLPFKRFQIQPVWRADRPQKGRYREFYQCDADVIGTDSLTCEADIILMINQVFSRLGIEDYTIKINNRKILSALAEVLNVSDQSSDLFVAIDKLDKIGWDGVKKELESKSFTNESLNTLEVFLTKKGDFDKKLSFINHLFSSSETGQKGIDEIKEILTYVSTVNSLNDAHLDFDLKLARGLSYYTGAIFEVVVNNIKMGSVSGGGRYDDLTGVFGFDGVSGVGISFGVDRLYDVMNELNLFPETHDDQTKLLFCYDSEESKLVSYQQAQKVRSSEISCEVYPDIAKFKKQLGYANKKNIPFAAIIGEEEIKSQKITLKDLNSGKQQRCSVEELIEIVNQ